MFAQTVIFITDCTLFIAFFLWHWLNYTFNCKYLSCIWLLYQFFMFYLYRVDVLITTKERSRISCNIDNCFLSSLNYSCSFLWRCSCYYLRDWIYVCMIFYIEPFALKFFTNWTRMLTPIIPRQIIFLFLVDDQWMMVQVFWLLQILLIITVTIIVFRNTIFFACYAYYILLHLYPDKIYVFYLHNRIFTEHPSCWFLPAPPSLTTFRRVGSS